MCLLLSVCVCVCVRDGLAVPVVDLLDVSEHNLVFSSHVLWNPSDLQPGHEALRHTQVLDYVSQVRVP